MRRPSVHRVEQMVRATALPGAHFRAVLYTGSFRTACGITGGADLLRLAGINNGRARLCGNCYPGVHPQRRPRPTPDSRWAPNA